MLDIQVEFMATRGVLYMESKVTLQGVTWLTVDCICTDGEAWRHRACRKALTAGALLSL